MKKLFESSEYVAEGIKNEFSSCGLEAYGINLKVISTVKAKNIISVAKASATTEFVSKQDTMLIVTVYEAAFERLDENGQKIFIEAALSNVSYDSEKDKLNIDNNVANMLHRMRHKYGNGILDILELNELIVQQIEDEEKEAKEAKKLERENKRKQK